MSYPLLPLHLSITHLQRRMFTNQSLARPLTNLSVLIVWAFLLGAPSARSAASSNRAGLVIVHGNGQTIKRCVEFAEAQITGLDLLTRAGWI